MDVLEKVRSEIANFDYIRFSLCDISGRNRGVMVPARNAEEYLELGVNMLEETLLIGEGEEQVSIPNIKIRNHGDAAVVPDLKTLRPIPWAGKHKFNVAEFLCESRWKSDYSPQEACPRHVLKHQLHRLHRHGLHLRSSYEFEFQLFQAFGMKPLFKDGGYMDSAVNSVNGPMLFQMDQFLLESRVNIDSMTSKREPGQFEVSVRPDCGIEGIDMAVNCKQGIIEIAEKLGLKASFIPKYPTIGNGAGSLFNHALLSNDSCKNVLYDSSAQSRLSKKAYHWMAGIIHHTPALTAFCCPTVNCYRRLFKSLTPNSVYWAVEDRAASLRVVKARTDVVLQNRLSSAKANPYLVAAATIAAGLDGLENNIVCPPPGPCHALPGSLADALYALESDDVFVKGLGEECVQWFMRNRKTELKHFENITGNEFAAEQARYL